MPRSSAIFARNSAKLEAILSTHGFTILFLTTYGISVFLMFLWGFCTEQKGGMPYDWYISFARAAGYVLNFNTALVLLLASRLFLTLLRDTILADFLPLDKAFPLLHIVVAYTIVVAVIIHVVFHFLWLGGWSMWKPGLWKFTMTSITGGVLLFIFVIMFYFARPTIRKNRFRLFYIVHLVCAFLFFLVLIFHGMYNMKPETYKYVVPAIIVYILDRIIRIRNTSSQDLELNASNSSFKDDNILQLSFPKPFDFRPGQYAEIMVPSINHEWHPFTIASAPYQSEMSFYIKSLGDWTERLHSEFQSRLNGEEEEALNIRVRGPFGAPTQGVNKYQRVFLISGGIGGTPFTSICKQLHYQHERHDAPISSTHRAKRNEQAVKDSLLAEGAEKRIQDAVAAIYDVNVKDLADEPVASTNVARLDHVAGMLRVAQRANSTFISQRKNKSQPTDRLNQTFNESIHHPQEEETSKEEPTKRGDDFDYGDDLYAIDEAFSTTSDSSSNEDEEVFGPSWMVSKQKSSSRRKIMDMLSPSRLFNRLPENSFTHPASFTDSDKQKRQKMARLNEFRSNLLLFLHTSRVTFFLSLLCIARMAIVIAGSIFESDFIELNSNPVKEGEVAKGLWVPLSYGIISLPLILILTITIISEISLLGGIILKSMNALLEIFIFCPIGVCMTIIEFRRYILRSPGGPIVVLLQYIFVQAIMFILIIRRMWMSIGKRGLAGVITTKEDDSAEQLMSCECCTHSTIPDADFVWTTPYSGDDAWLCRELAPVADGRALRLHRYITRQKKDSSDSLIESSVDIELGQSKALEKITKTGRPEWDKLLAKAVRDTRSDGVVGIFFCGPHQMGAAIRESAKKIEMWSNLRDAYLRTTEVSTLMNDLGLTDATMVRRLTKFGCRIRFVYHEENFS